jgi:hypothetical protein
LCRATTRPTNLRDAPLVAHRPSVDLPAERIDPDRPSPTGAGDHVPEALGALQQQVLDVIVIDPLNGRNRSR